MEADQRDRSSIAAVLTVPDNVVSTLIRQALSQDRTTGTLNGAQSPPRAILSTSKPKSSSRFPSSWSPGSIIQLVPPKQSDTTDRTLFRRARTVRFDPAGYEQERGLRHRLFYKSGYLSCTECNHITFIDAAALRTILELKAVLESEDLRPESLPPCSGCGETRGLRVGAHDFLQLIEGGKEALILRRRLERAAAKTIQRAFRRHLNILWSKAEIARQRTFFLLGYRSAQVIQAMARGRLGRRVFETEKWLVVVKQANRLLIKHALSNYPHRRRVFWYKNEAEEAQLYSDYRLLIERTGFRPTRTVVEANIREIAIRVLERQTELVRRIQARWRGLSVRKYLIVFRRELRRQREVRACMVFKIQRIGRGWLHRKKAVRRRLAAAEEVARRKYLDQRTIEGHAQTQNLKKIELCKAYVVERQEELTARLMGHTEPKLAGGHKMKAFHESTYGDDVVTELIANQVQAVLRHENEYEEKDKERQKRAEWVRLRQLEDPQLAFYFRDEVAARNEYVINKLKSVASARRALTKVSTVLRHHNQTGGRKYDFPDDINLDPMKALSEKHATDVQALMQGVTKAGPERTRLR